MSALVDTSCLLRLSSPDDPREAETQAAVDRMTDIGEALQVAPQNFVEFRSVATRPTAVNGLGLTLAEADSELDRFSLLFSLLPEEGFIHCGATCADRRAFPVNRFTTRAWRQSALWPECKRF